MSGVFRAVSTAFWPVGHIMLAAAIPEEKVKLNKAGKLPPADGRPEYRGAGAAVTFTEHLAVHMGSVPKFIAALICYYYFFPKDVSVFKVLSFDNAGFLAALKMIVARDLAITWFSAGFWDYMVYFSPLADKFATNKFNPAPAKQSQRLHDMFWTHISTFVSTAYEVLVLHWMANGYAAWTPTEWWKDPTTILWLLSMPYWRLTHFFFLHRGMHPWRTTRVPDVGKFLYDWVHSLHHKSKNPISWSGISMHPVESTGYYTAMLVPVLAGPWTAAALTWAGVPPAVAWISAHPLVMLYTKMDLTMAALIGHDGFGYPGGGSQAHWLHHNNFECNYGEAFAPWDILFGSYVVDEADFVSKFGGKGVGEATKGRGKKAA